MSRSMSRSMSMSVRMGVSMGEGVGMGKGMGMDGEGQREYWTWALAHEHASASLSISYMQCRSDTVPSSLALGQTCRFARHGPGLIRPIEPGVCHNAELCHVVQACKLQHCIAGACPNDAATLPPTTMAPPRHHQSITIHRSNKNSYSNHHALNPGPPSPFAFPPLGRMKSGDTTCSLGHEARGSSNNTLWPTWSWVASLA